MPQVKVTDYSIADYGIEHCKNFQGHGCGRHYSYAALGCGNSYSEALEDALEQAAYEGFDIELQHNETDFNAGDTAQEVHEQYCDERDHDDCEHELYYYVGIRWNG